MKHRSFLKGNISILFRGIKNNKKSFSRFSYHTVTLPEYQLITCDRSLFFLSPSCHTYISLWRQCDSRIIFLSRITHWNTISMTVWQEKCQKTFFVYANEKIHRQITLLYRLFFDVSYFLIITKIVAVPIQVQSSSNSSPIGDWNYMGLELVIPMFKSYSAEKKQRFLQENHLFLWWK